MTDACPAKLRSPVRVADDGWRIPDLLWERIAPLLPPRQPHPLGCHNPRVPDRRAMDAIFFVLRTGCCSHSAAHRRFQEWGEAGVFLALWQAGLLVYDQLTDGNRRRARGPRHRGRQPPRPEAGQAEA